MKKLFEVTSDEMEWMKLKEEPSTKQIAEKYGFKWNTVEFTGGGTNQFFAEKAVKDLAPVSLGSELNAENFTALQLSKFPYRVEDLQKKADEYSKLEVKDVNDKEGLKILTRARIELKGDVAGIRKAGKQLREFTTQFNRDVISREDELAGILEPVRDALQKRENEIEEQKEAIRIAKEKEEDDRINGMISKLAAVGHAVDYSEIKGYTDEKFEEVLTEAINIHNEKVKRDQEEADNLRLQKEKEVRERKEEAERLEKQRKQQDEENKKIAAQQEQIRADQEKIRLDKEKIEKEKKDILIQRATNRLNTLRGIGMFFEPDMIKLCWQSKDGKNRITMTVKTLEDATDENFAILVKDCADQIEQGKKEEIEREALAKKENDERIAREKQEAIDKALKEKAEQEQKAKEDRIGASSALKLANASFLSASIVAILIAS